MRVNLHFTLIFAARTSHQSIDNNVKMFTQTQTHTVNGPLILAYLLHAVDSGGISAADRKQTGKHKNDYFF